MFSRFKADRSGSGGGGGGSCGSGGGNGSNGAGGGSSSPSQTLLEGNAITTFFEIGRQTATAGPGYLWKVHDAYRKSDGKVFQFHFFNWIWFVSMNWPKFQSTKDKDDDDDDDWLLKYVWFCCLFSFCGLFSKCKQILWVAEWKRKKDWKKEGRRDIAVKIGWWNSRRRHQNWKKINRVLRVWGAWLMLNRVD